MRLIDADAITNSNELATKIFSLNLTPYIEVDDLLDFIDKLPTIEAAPVVHGEWIKEENTWVCSVCRKENACAYSEELERFLDFFCPKCGADMRNGGD